MSNRPVVHLIDQDPHTRPALALLLRISGVRVQEYDGVAAFLRIAGRADAGCILIDIRSNGPGDRPPLAALGRQQLRFPIIGILSGFDPPEILGKTLGATTHFLHRPVGKAAMLDAIQKAFGRREQADTASSNEQAAVSKVACLTPREQDVLGALARGQSNKLMAIELGISPRTAEIHRAHVMAKLNVSSLSEALQIAFAAGIHISGRPTRPSA